MVVFSVLYPQKAGARFDEAYYQATHVPLMRDVFGQHLKDLQVLKGLPTADGGAPAFALIANLVFESPEAMAAGLASPRMPEVMADVAKFTDIVPVAQAGLAI